MSAAPWRVGRTVGRTVYDVDGQLIGVMDTPELAQRVVTAVNAAESPDVVMCARCARRMGTDQPVWWTKSGPCCTSHCANLLQRES